MLVDAARELTIEGVWRAPDGARDGEVIINTGLDAASGDVAVTHRLHGESDSNQ